MNHADFERVFRAQMELCERVLVRKGVEYASDEDRLHNFKVAAAIQNETPIEALGGMLAKHIVSIFDLIRSEKDVSLAMWDEKIGDAMNYLILLKALVVEEWQTEADAEQLDNVTNVFERVTNSTRLAAMSHPSYDPPFNKFRNPIEPNRNPKD